MSKSGGTLYNGVPHSKFWGGRVPRPPKVYASAAAAAATVHCSQRTNEGTDATCRINIQTHIHRHTYIPATDWHKAAVTSAPE